MQGRTPQFFLWQYSRQLVAFRSACSTNSEESSLSLFVNTTLKSKLLCRIKEAAKQGMIAELMDLYVKTAKRECGINFMMIYFISKTPYICCSHLFPVVVSMADFSFSRDSSFRFCTCINGTCRMHFTSQKLSSDMIGCPIPFQIEWPNELQVVIFL